MHRYIVSYVDTCLGEYLQDHHNREGEWLVGVECDDLLTDPVGAVLDAIASLEDPPEHADLEQAVRDCLRGVSFGLPDGCSPFEPPSVWILITESN